MITVVGILHKGTARIEPLHDHHLTTQVTKSDRLSIQIGQAELRGHRPGHWLCMDMGRQEEQGTNNWTNQPVAVARTSNSTRHRVSSPSTDPRTLPTVTLKSDKYLDHGEGAEMV
jgi:hypothetical protein